jgi:hypothetical protein
MTGIGLNKSVHTILLRHTSKTVKHLHGTTSTGRRELHGSRVFSCVCTRRGDYYPFFCSQPITCQIEEPFALSLSFGDMK